MNRSDLAALTHTAFDFFTFPEPDPVEFSADKENGIQSNRWIPSDCERTRTCCRAKMVKCCAKAKVKLWRNKKIIHGADSRMAVLPRINTLADVVKVTLGPNRKLN